MRVEGHARVGFREPREATILRPISLAGVRVLCLQAMPCQLMLSSWCKAIILIGYYSQSSGISQSAGEATVASANHPRRVSIGCRVLALFVLLSLVRCSPSHSHDPHSPLFGYKRGSISAASFASGPRWGGGGDKASNTLHQ